MPRRSSSSSSRSTSFLLIAVGGGIVNALAPTPSRNLHLRSTPLSSLEGTRVASIERSAASVSSSSSSSSVSSSLPSLELSSLDLPIMSRDADFMEQLTGGVRYSMIPLPSDMLATTLFVSQLDEFVYDHDLSTLFDRMPACVVRKVDTTSLQYGFVAFRTAQDAHAARMRTHGFRFRGKTLNVQPIRRDVPVVKVPERLVAFVKGTPAVRRILERESSNKPKKKKSGTTGTATTSITKKNRKKETFQKGNVKVSKSWSPPTPTVSLSSTNHMNRNPSSLSLSSMLFRHVKPEQQADLDRALARGYLVVDSPSHRHGGGSRPHSHSHHFSPLLASPPPRVVSIHRQYCAAHNQPQVILIKGGRGGGGGGVQGCRPDRVLIDLAPLVYYQYPPPPPPPPPPPVRDLVQKSNDDDDDDGDNVPDSEEEITKTTAIRSDLITRQRQKDIWSAAQRSGCGVSVSVTQPPRTETLSSSLTQLPDDPEEEEACASVMMTAETKLTHENHRRRHHYDWMYAYYRVPVVNTLLPEAVYSRNNRTSSQRRTRSSSSSSSSSSSTTIITNIRKVPPLSVGIFEGDRPAAKAMAKELVQLWDLVDVAV